MGFWGFGLGFMAILGGLHLSTFVSGRLGVLLMLGPHVPKKSHTSLKSILGCDHPQILQKESDRLLSCHGVAKAANYFRF